MKTEHKTFLQYLGIPGLISMTGLAFGWIAIVLLLQNQPYLAITFAILAFFSDCLDGYIARRTNTTSEFGRQLDGTFDFFNYLVFSALLFWRYITPNILGIVVGFIMLTTGAFRLIRFNIEGFVVKDNQLYYAGIVVCHVALATILLFLAKQFFPTTIYLAPFVMIGVSALQVSRILVKKTNTYSYWLTLAFILLVISLWFHIWHR